MRGRLMLGWRLAHVRSGRIDVRRLAIVLLWGRMTHVVCNRGILGPRRGGVTGLRSSLPRRRTCDIVGMRHVRSAIGAGRRLVLTLHRRMRLPVRLGRGRTSSIVRDRRGIRTGSSGIVWASFIRSCRWLGNSVVRAWCIVCRIRTICIVRVRYIDILIGGICPLGRAWNIVVSAVTGSRRVYVVVARSDIAGFARLRGPNRRIVRHRRITGSRYPFPVEGRRLGSRRHFWTSMVH